jgi:hypothetical protein
MIAFDLRRSNAEIQQSVRAIERKFTSTQLEAFHSGANFNAAWIVFEHDWHQRVGKSFN